MPGVEGGKNESFSGATNGHQLENEANGFFSRNEQCWVRREINNPFSFTSHGQVVSSFWVSAGQIFFLCLLRPWVYWWLLNRIGTDRCSFSFFNPVAFKQGSDRPTGGQGRPTRGGGCNSR